jgi:hypothetical protein
MHNAGIVGNFREQTGKAPMAVLELLFRRH